MSASPKACALSCRARAASASSRARPVWPTATKPVIRASTRRTAAPARRKPQAAGPCGLGCGRASTADVSSAAACSSLAARNRCSRSVSRGLGGRRPTRGGGQAGAAVEVAVLAARARPVLGGLGEVVPGPLSLEVVLEPATQPRPGADDGLVGELDRVGVTGDEPRGDHLVDELLLDRVDDHLAARDLARAPARRRGPGTTSRSTRSRSCARSASSSPSTAPRPTARRHRGRRRRPGSRRRSGCGPRAGARSRAGRGRAAAARRARPRSRGPAGRSARARATSPCWRAGSRSPGAATPADIGPSRNRPRSTSAARPG